MSKRGRPRKRQSLFTVKNYIEFTSDSDSDNQNVLNNVSYEIDRGSFQSIQRRDPELQSEIMQTWENSISEEDDMVQTEGPTPDEDNPISFDEQQAPPPQPQQQPHLQPQEQPMQQPHLQPQHQQPHLQPQHQQPMQQPHLQPQPEQQPQDGQEEHLSDSSGISDDILYDEEDDYSSILKKLKSDWLLAEIDHCVSKSASEAFWKIGLMYFTKLANAARKKKTPLFKSIRTKMYDDLLPPVGLEIAYKNKSNGEIVTINDTITQVKRFPPDKYEKIYEIGTVKVS